MTKDELRQEIERLKAEVKRLEALVATLGTGRVNMIETSKIRVQQNRADPDQYDV